MAKFLKEKRGEQTSGEVVDSPISAQSVTTPLPALQAGLQRQSFAPEAGYVQIPPPTTLNEAVSMVQLLADKMGERLAFERISTKLYEGLIAKCQMTGELHEGPSLAELRLLRQEKVRNFLILKDTIEELGGDPTEPTASAECAMIATSGLLHVVKDEKTTIAQAVDAVLVSELADNEGWNVLIYLCYQLGRPDLAERFEVALAHEKVHLQKMRAWVLAALVSQAR